MDSRIALARGWLAAAFQTLHDNLYGLSLSEALFVPQGGYRSVLGTLKHTAAWAHVYRSYAFDEHPTNWLDVAWPHDLRDTILPSQAYLDKVLAWTDLSHELWQRDLQAVSDADLDQPRPLHWGERRPLADIVRMVTMHYVYHAGEINQLLSIARQEGWENGEEVEENLAPSEGHRVVPPWKG